MAATTVLERASLRVVDWRCTEPPGAPGFVERHGEHSLAYVRSGSFGYHSRGRRHELIAGQTLGTVHVALRAADRASVDRFHQRAIAAGGRDNGSAGLRPDYGPTVCLEAR